MGVSVIIPAHNEERRIGKTLEAYSKYFNRLKKEENLNYELIVVINNTQDRTEDIVKQYKKKNPNIKYLNFKQGGKGFAVIEGFKDALQRKNDLIGFVDADRATLPEDFYDLIKNIGKYDGIIASRYMKGSIIRPKPTIARLIAKRMFNIFIRSILFLPFRDTQCGAKIFKRHALEKTIPKLSLSQWAFDVDLLYSMKLMKFKIKEIPTKWTDKEYSKINFWKAGPKMATAVIRLRILNSPFRFIILAYDKLQYITSHKFHQWS